MNRIAGLLASGYGIVSNDIAPAPGGFSTKASYRIESVDGNQYFLKVYAKTLPTTRLFVERVDAYMPVLAWLSASEALHGRILSPVRARGGAYKTEQGDEAYVLFEYADGKAPGIQGVTREQTAELAEILALLHDISETVPFETPGLEEDVSLRFCGRLARFLDQPDGKNGALFEIVSPHAGLLLEAIGETLRLRDALRQGCAPLVLCHGDAHGNNLIQGERLVLADWEELRWAPAEADLFIHAWHPHGSALLETYSSKRKSFRANHALLRFYILRRRIEDIWVDIQRLTEESPDETETKALLGYIRQSIEEVQAIDRKRA